jgi:hypothetical protein
MNVTQPWHRRHAIHIASELPDDPEDAIMVLKLAMEVVETFLREKPSKPLAGERATTQGAAMSELTPQHVLPVLFDGADPRMALTCGCQIQRRPRKPSFSG